MTTRTFPTRSHKAAMSPAIRNRIVAEARGWIGTPYMHQASLKGVGCDCLGLLRGVWRAIHGMEPEPLPAYAADWAQANGEERLAAAARRQLIEIDSRRAATCCCFAGVRICRRSTRRLFRATIA